MIGPSMNMAAGIREFGRATPHRDAVVDGDRRLTFAGLDERSNRLGAGLLAAGLHPGDRVAVMSRNRMEYFEIAAGLAKAGLPMVSLNPNGTVADNAFVAAHSQVRGLIVDDDLAAGVGDLVDEIDVVVALGGVAGVDYETFLAGASATDPAILVDERDTFCVTYTSGTTGRPKGVELTHRGRMLNNFGSALEWGLGPSRRTMAVAPMYLGAGFAFAYTGPQFGGTTAVLRSWSPDAFLEGIAEHRVSSVFLVPTHAQQIRRLAEEPGRAYDLSSLTTLFFNAAALPVALKQWVHEAFPGVGIHELYGSTECSVVTNLRPEDSLRKPGSVGHPWFTQEVRLLDPDGDEVAAGEPGELYARSPMQMKGYLHDEAATRAARTDDGFITVGDIAVRDDEGFISIVDRKKDMIIAGGVNIYPREIEEVLARHPLIDDVAVVGLPDAVYGERIAAFVVARPGNTLDAAGLECHARGEIAAYKVPREWHVVAQLPRNPSGKILKRDIRAQHLLRANAAAGPE